jgi:hypothetical protein
VGAWGLVDELPRAVGLERVELGLHGATPVGIP